MPARTRSGYDYKTARRSIDLLMLEWQNRGLNLWTVRDATVALIAGTSSYDLTSEKLDIIEGLLRTDAGDTSKQSDLTMGKLGQPVCASDRKLTQGRPLQYYVDASRPGLQCISGLCRTLQPATRSRITTGSH